jgi:hypothetical protein
MKKHVWILSIASLIFIGTAARVPLFAEEKDWILIATWVNPAYDGENVYAPKCVFTSDGKITQYYHIAGSLPRAVGTYVIESDWTEPGVHWFKVKSVYLRWTYFEIAKLTNEGNTYESVSSTETYPPAFDTSGQQFSYEIRTRYK